MLISIIIAVSHALSQNSEIKFTHLYVEDGMSEETGLCIIQDRRGFIWIGTQIGLDRYDGYKFKVYFHDPYDTNSISDNGILSVIEDSDGFLWFGTRGGGLNKYDPVYDIFKHYKYDPDDPNSLSNNIVNVVFKDKTGTLWLGTRGGGLNRFDKENETFIHYKHDPSRKNSLSNNNVRSIYEDHFGTLWIGTEGGLDKFDKKKGTFIHYRHNPSDPASISHNVINSIYEDKSGTLWIGTHGGGLNKLLPPVNEGSSPTFMHYKYDRNDPKSLSNNSINVMMEDKNGMLWIGTDNGLIIYSPENETFITINPKKLNDNIIQSIYEDNTGSIWVGTWAGGVSKYDPRMEQFAHYYYIPDDPNSLSHNYVKGFQEDKYGMIWVLTHGGGLNKFDRKTGKFTHYKHQPGNPNSLSNNITRDICIDKNGILWIGTQGGGLNRFDPETEIFTHYRHDPNNPNSLCDDKIDAVFEDSKGILWIGTRGGGLNKFFPDSEIFVHYKHNPSDPKSISSNDIYVILEDYKGTMWFGTWGGGINKIDRTTGEFIRYVHDPNDTNSISYDVISAMYQDEPDILWIGTWGGGLNRFDMKKETFKAYTKKDGLPNNIVSTLSGDDHGNLWVCTNGLSKFSFQGKEYINPIIRNYDVHDGLQSNQFVGRANYKNAKGELFFGGTNGFNIFHPDSIKDASNVPPIVIISFKKFNKEAKLDKSITYTRSIELNYRENVFSFEFVALDYSASHKNQYAYLMEGFDKDWIYTEEDRIAKYTNLDPGEYIFRVKGTNKDGVWNEESATVKITILPPFWKTWWFYLLCTIIGISSLFGIYRLRVRNLHIAKKYLEHRVNVRTIEVVKQKEEIKKQKEKIEEKNKDITDSILYAVRIQKAILPKEEQIKELFPKSFVLFRPKDIVSGDFYFLASVKQYTIIAVVDCTGHGVPGAFMSMIGNDFLNQIVLESHVTTSAKALTMMDKKVIQTLKPEGTEVQDGMDIAFCVLNNNNNTLQYAGANRPLLLFKNGKLTEFNPDKLAIGGYREKKKCFTNHNIELKKGDTFYIFSDGYIDQFGGTKNKKFMRNKFKELLISIQDNTMEEQKEILIKTIDSWKGDTEQVDDICVIGVRM